MKFYLFEWNGGRWAITEDEEDRGRPLIISKIAHIERTDRVALDPITEMLHMASAWRKAGRPGEVTIPEGRN